MHVKHFSKKHLSGRTFKCSDLEGHISARTFKWKTFKCPDDLLLFEIFMKMKKSLAYKVLSL